MDVDAVGRLRPAVGDIFQDGGEGDLMEPPKTDPVVGPLASKLQRLRYLKRRKDGQRFDISEIAEEVSRLYAQDKILVVRQKLTDAGATADEITAAVDE